MTVFIEQEFYAVVSEGNIRRIEEIRVCPTQDLAIKVADEETEMSGQEMVIVPIRASIPMELVGGDLRIVKPKK